MLPNSSVFICKTSKYPDTKYDIRCSPNVYRVGPLLYERLYELNHKSVQISEFVWINEAHYFICVTLLNYSNRAYTFGKILQWNSHH